VVTLIRAALTSAAVACALIAPASGPAQRAPAQELNVVRPFGTLREQADLRQQWLRLRMETVVPALMRKLGVDLWVIPMR
jgi:hypothetical protein